jgi:hypothetical protein
MFPIGHVPTQIYVNKTYIPHYNLAIIYIYFVEYFLYVWTSCNGFTIDSLENYQVFKRKHSPFLWKHINLHRTIIFFMTSDILDRKLNKENQICNFSSFFNEKGILIEIWYSMNFCVKNLWPWFLKNCTIFSFDDQIFWKYEHCRVEWYMTQPYSIHDE